MSSKIDTEGRPLSQIHIGGIWAAGKPSVVRTVLGSCIAVCLRDPKSLVGGMNHFMLPSGSSADLSVSCYGIHSMELLINACMKHGAQRKALEAKVFGGGHVLRMREFDGNVPQSNIRFTLDFLNTEGIPVVSQDVGGYSARELFFFTDTGRTLMRRMNKTGTSMEDQAELDMEERRFKPAVEQPDATHDNVTLF